MNSSKILFKLALNQTKDKKNILTVIAVILTSVLFSVLFTVVVSLMDNFEMQTLKQTNNSAHAAIMYIDDEKYSVIEEKKDMYSMLGYEKIVSESILYGDNEMRNSVFANMNDEAMALTFCEVTEGSKPLKANEIAMDESTLKSIDSNLKVGDKIELTYGIGNTYISNEFIISGTWSSNNLKDVSFILVSDEFVDELSKKHNGMVGVVHAYLQFEDKSIIEQSLDSLVAECGMQNEQYNVNWAYLSNSMGDNNYFKLSVACVILIIGMTGYLLINNIYQISFLNNARYYGLLKTIGFSMGQLRSVILFEAFAVSVVGIIIGNLTGYIVGHKLFPFIIEMTNIEFVEQSIDYRSFVLTFIFTLLTVFISVFRPCEYLKKVTPIEATRL